PLPAYHIYYKIDIGNAEDLNNTTEIVEIESDKENLMETFTVHIAFF
ncbi:28826_t:CDS:1, partial [Gigaspora margarita]